jgi:hypothetical protein
MERSSCGRPGAETAVRTPLSNLDETVSLEKSYDLARLENRSRPHLGDSDRANPDELRFERRLAILQEHLDHFVQIALKLI